jgi:hypothetical protein
LTVRRCFDAAVLRRRIALALRPFDCVERAWMAQLQQEFATGEMGFGGFGAAKS